MGWHTGCQVLLAVWLMTDPDADRFEHHFTHYQDWGWDEVPDPRDNRIVSDMIVNVQTGTGNRIEFWDTHGTPLSSKGRVRRYIDVGRLTKGR